MSHTIHLHEVADALQAAYPNIAFRITYDSVGIFVRYTGNAPGAPNKEDDRAMLQTRFADVVFKIPKLINRQLN